VRDKAVNEVETDQRLRPPWGGTVISKILILMKGPHTKTCKDNRSDMVVQSQFPVAGHLHFVAALCADLGSPRVVDVPVAALFLAAGALLESHDPTRGTTIDHVFSFFFFLFCDFFMF
jgi:hypothetical protein